MGGVRDENAQPVRGVSDENAPTSEKPMTLTTGELPPVMLGSKGWS